MFRFASLAAALSMAALPALADPNAGAVTLTFDTAAPTGAVMVALYGSEQAYEGGDALVRARVDVAAGERSVTFEALPAGDYAAKVFHDVDGDGAMNTNPFGQPTEPYGFSNNAVGAMGPARWERARFAVSGPTAQTITLR